MQQHLLWQRKSFEYGPDLKLFRVRWDEMINPRNQHHERMVVLEGGDAVQIVARTPADTLLLVKQYRFGVGEEILELPGGLIDEGEQPLMAAQRELLEETGYQAQHWHYLGKNPANPVFQSAFIHTFFADQAVFEATPQQDLGENINSTSLPMADVKAHLLAGAFPHPHTISGLLRWWGWMEQANMS